MTESIAAAPKLRVRTRAIDHIPSLLPYLSSSDPLVFLRRGQGVAGLGETLRLEFGGASRIRDAAAAWRRIVEAAVVDDPVRRSGSGLLAFGAFAFDETSTATSVLIVPRVVLGRRAGTTWVTRIALGDDDSVLDEDASFPVFTATDIPAARAVDLRPGLLDGAGYRDAVSDAVTRIRSGEVSKVVVARDLVGQSDPGADARRVMSDLAAAYPDTWTFAVDGLIGSSPETLVRVKRGDVSARVLAGSIGRGATPEADAAAEARLKASTKDLDEHRFAVRSVLASLEPHAREVTANETPFALELPNLWHLASDVEGTLADGSTVLDLVCELHPTAAVAGTPRDAALAAIRELEPFDRLRYGGPVGWVDGYGDGKWAIALRSAEVDADGAVHAFAGAGIVAESDPEQELVETGLKFRPIVEAFERRLAPPA